jgi:hypothetical protein
MPPDLTEDDKAILVDPLREIIERDQGTPSRGGAPGLVSGEPRY